MASEPQPDMTFTKELRQATKEVHSISDKLVNAKFAIALTDDRVWADGLLAFYEVYKFLEEKLPAELLPPELHRKAAFEKDLNHFLGDKWQENYEPRESVKQYIKHLEKVHQKSPLHLFAYAFQMYMAVMSGGQLLQRKRMLKRRLLLKEDDIAVNEKLPAGADPDDLQSRPMPLQVTVCPPGCHATFFTRPILELKAKLRTILNDNYGSFSETMRDEFIEETRNVFLRNIEVIRSIKGINRANLRILGYVAAAVAAAYFAFKLVRE